MSPAWRVGALCAIGRQPDEDQRGAVARIGAELLDAVVITTGSHAYRRADGIGVVPAALLGP